MVQYPVHHRRREYRVAHHLYPVRYLFVGREDNGALLVGVADEAEETVSLLPRDGGKSNLVSCEAILM